MFYHKFTEREGKKVLAVCDKDLLGKVLENEDFSFEVKEEFYGKESINKKRLAEKAGKSSIINAIGNKAVSFLTEKGFFDEENVLKIEGVAHAQMIKI